MLKALSFIGWHADCLLPTTLTEAWIKAMKFDLLSSASFIAIAGAVGAGAPTIANAGVAHSTTAATYFLSPSATVVTDIGSFSGGFAGTPATGSVISINQFDTSLGTLKSIDLKENTAFNSTLTLQNNSSSVAPNFSYTVQARMSVFSALAGPVFPTLNSYSTTSGSYASVAGSATINIPWTPSKTSAENIATGLSAFEGLSTFDVLAATKFKLSATGGGGNIGLSQTSTVTPSVTITYNYTTTSVSTPEPATLAVLGAGLAGIGVIRRRRKA